MPAPHHTWSALAFVGVLALSPSALAMDDRDEPEPPDPNDNGSEPEPGGSPPQAPFVLEGNSFVELQIAPSFLDAVVEEAAKELEICPTPKGDDPSTIITRVEVSGAPTLRRGDLQTVEPNFHMSFEQEQVELAVPIRVFTNTAACLDNLNCNTPDSEPFENLSAVFDVSLAGDQLCLAFDDVYLGVLATGNTDIAIDGQCLSLPFSDSLPFLAGRTVTAEALSLTPDGNLAVRREYDHPYFYPYSDEAKSWEAFVVEGEVIQPLVDGDWSMFVGEGLLRHTLSAPLKAQFPSLVDTGVVNEMYQTSSDWAPLYPPFEEKGITRILNSYHAQFPIPGLCAIDADLSLRTALTFDPATQRFHLGATLDPDEDEGDVAGCITAAFFVGQTFQLLFFLSDPMAQIGAIASVASLVSGLSQTPLHAEGDLGDDCTFSIDGNGSFAVSCEAPLELSCEGQIGGDLTTELDCDASFAIPSFQIGNRGASVALGIDELFANNEGAVIVGGVDISPSPARAPINVEPLGWEAEYQGESCEELFPAYTGNFYVGGEGRVCGTKLLSPNLISFSVPGSSGTEVVVHEYPEGPLSIATPTILSGYIFHTSHYFDAPFDIIAQVQTTDGVKRVNLGRPQPLGDEFVGEEAMGDAYWDCVLSGIDDYYEEGAWFEPPGDWEISNPAVIHFDPQVLDPGRVTLHGIDLLIPVFVEQAGEAHQVLHLVAVADVFDRLSGQVVQTVVRGSLLTNSVSSYDTRTGTWNVWLPQSTEFTLIDEGRSQLEVRALLPEGTFFQQLPTAIEEPSTAGGGR